MTLSSYEACVQLEDYLLKRLQKNDSNIKYKALNVIKVRAFPFSSLFHSFLSCFAIYASSNLHTPLSIPLEKEDPSLRETWASM